MKISQKAQSENISGIGQNRKLIRRHFDGFLIDCYFVVSRPCDKSTPTNSQCPDCKLEALPQSYEETNPGGKSEKAKQKSKMKSESGRKV